MLQTLKNFAVTAMILLLTACNGGGSKSKSDDKKKEDKPVETPTHAIIKTAIYNSASHQITIRGVNLQKDISEDNIKRVGYRLNDRGRQLTHTLVATPYIADNNGTLIAGEWSLNADNTELTIFLRRAGHNDQSLARTQLSFNSSSANNGLVCVTPHGKQPGCWGGLTTAPSGSFVVMGY